MSGRVVELERVISGAETASCTRCGGELVAKMDAIARVVYRCPKCDGVSKPQRLAPDLIPASQRLVPASAITRGTLPLCASGSLRCQGCAGQVEGFSRFCVDCGPKHDFVMAMLSARIEARVQREIALALATRTVSGGIDRRRVPRTEPMPAEQREKIAASLKQRTERGLRTWPDRTCGCGVIFTPTAPNQKKHAIKCTGRPADATPEPMKRGPLTRPRQFTKVRCACGLVFTPTNSRQRKHDPRCTGAPAEVGG